MARRTVLTSRQRSALFDLPQREADLLRHYTLSDEDLQNIGARRRPHNKLGFALQLCVLRHPGRLLAPGEYVPPAVVDFIGRQLDVAGDATVTGPRTNARKSRASTTTFSRPDTVEAPQPHASHAGQPPLAANQIVMTANGGLMMSAMSTEREIRLAVTRATQSETPIRPAPHNPQITPLMTLPGLGPLCLACSFPRPSRPFRLSRRWQTRTRNVPETVVRLKEEVRVPLRPA